MRIFWGPSIAILIANLVAIFIALAGALFAPALAAQTIEQLEWIDANTTGNNAGTIVERAARIRFSANVHYLRQVPRADEWSDRWQFSFHLVAADEAVINQVVEEGRRLAAKDGLPQLDLSYVPLANVPTKLVTLRFASPVQVTVRQASSAREVELVVRVAAKVERAEKVNGASNRPPMLPPMAENPADRHYAVLLQRQARDDGVAHLPKALADYALFTRADHGGANANASGAEANAAGTGSALLLGYFKTATDAANVRGLALPNFPNAEVVALDLAPAAAAASIATTAPTETAPSAATVDAQAAALLSEGLQALQKKRSKAALDAFNRGLLLPPNASSAALQAQIGAAWELQNQPDKARLEYQLYLKLYPNGADAASVQQRLAALGPQASASASAPSSATSNAVKAKPSDNSRYSATGSVSQYYYGGNTRTETLVNIASGIDQNTLNLTNQSVLVSSWDASMRYQGDDAETKLVMRGAHSDNLTSTSTATAATQGLVSAAYVDYRRLESRLSVRVGRQSAIGGALFGLFDGVSMAMPFGGDYKLDAMLGVPANTLVSAPQQGLAGVMIEADNIAPHWGGNLSLVEQSTEGISDRRAIGVDARYFGEALSLFTQLDYDINFNVLNAATVQGSMPGPWDTNLTLMLDDRKAPSLQLSDALISSGFTSLSQLLAMKSLAEVQGLALSTTAEAQQAMFSVSRALSPKWQGSVDFRYANVSALPAIGNFQATPATGAQYNVSLQLTGSNLYSTRDVNGINLSYLTSPTLTGTQLGFNNMTGIWGALGSLEPSIRFYTQNDNTGTTVTRITPGLRLSYKLSNRASVMGEGIYETSQTDGPGTHETSTAFYYYMGYRYDFQ